MAQQYRQLSESPEMCRGAKFLAANTARYFYRTLLFSSRGFLRSAAKALLCD